jgi:hypothetical protein
MFESKDSPCAWKSGVAGRRGVSAVVVANVGAEVAGRTGELVAGGAGVLVHAVMKHMQKNNHAN